VHRATALNIASILGNGHTERGAWVILPCPFAPFKHDSGKDSNPSFGIQCDDPTGRYHCFSCNSSGDLMDLAIEVATLYSGKPTTMNIKLLMEVCAGAADEVMVSADSIPDYEEYSKVPTIDWDFPDWWLNNYPPVLESESACAYLTTREITPDVAVDLDMRWDEQQQRVCFPYRNQEGLLVGMNGRAILDSNTLRYYQYQYEGKTNLHLWYGEDTMSLDKPLLVTESVFDVASIKRVYPNVVAGFSCSFSKKKTLRLADAVEIVTLFDAGHGGDIARKNMRKYLGNTVTAQYTPKSDAGDMTVVELQELLGDVLKLNTP